MFVIYIPKDISELHYVIFIRYQTNNTCLSVVNAGNTH